MSHDFKESYEKYLKNEDRKNVINSKDGYQKPFSVKQETPKFFKNISDLQNLENLPLLYRIPKLY